MALLLLRVNRVKICRATRAALPSLALEGYKLCSATMARVSAATMAMSGLLRTDNCNQRYVTGSRADVEMSVSTLLPSARRQDREAPDRQRGARARRIIMVGGAQAANEPGNPDPSLPVWSPPAICPKPPDPGCQCASSS